MCKKIKKKALQERCQNIWTAELRHWTQLILLCRAHFVEKVQKHETQDVFFYKYDLFLGVNISTHEAGTSFSVNI